MSPVVDPVVEEVVAPVVDPVVEVVAPVVDPVVDEVAPVVDPVVDEVAPVVDPIVEVRRRGRRRDRWPHTDDSAVDNDSVDSAWRDNLGAGTASAHSRTVAPRLIDRAPIFRRPNGLD